MMLSRIAGLHVGSVEACSATEIKVQLDVDAPQDLALNTGRPQGFPRLNGYVLIPNEGGTVVALIARMTMEPEPAPTPRARDTVSLPVSRRRLFCTPIGTLESRRRPEEGEPRYRLSRGVASYPSVGDSVILPVVGQLRAVVEAAGDDRRVEIGTAPLALDAPVMIDPDKLFGRHLGVFGNTGSGKSCTVSGLIRWSIEAAAEDCTSELPVAVRFIVLDPNGEYRTCYDDLKDKVDVKVFSVEPDEDRGEKMLVVPGWMWNGQEWAGALNAAPATQRPVLMNALRELRGSSSATAVASADSRHLLLASRLKAFSEYLSRCRAQGVAALGVFPQFHTLRSNLEATGELLSDYLQSIRESEIDLYNAVEVAVNNVQSVLTTRQNNSGYPKPFHDSDMNALLATVGDILDILPTVGTGVRATEDTPVPFDLHALPGMINYLASVMPGNMIQHMAGLDLRIRSMLGDSRIMPLIAPDDETSFSNWLASLLGEEQASGGQITILDLSLVPSDVLTTIVAVLARLIFETAQRYRRADGKILPTVLVLEEAHNFVQRSGPTADETGPAVRCREVFEKIAKEGRKFGVGLVLSSQRPAELAPTVVAQCNSFILHRIVNDRDQDLISRLAPDSSGTLLRELPSLPTQKAILIGIATEIPLAFNVRGLEGAQRPSSANPDFWDVWTRRRQIDLDFDALAENWSQ